MYRIAWKSKDGKQCGYGEYCIADKEVAEGIARNTDRRNPNFEHWVEEEWPDVIGDESQTIQTEDYKR